MSDSNLHTCEKAAPGWGREGKCAECLNEETSRERLSSTFRPTIHIHLGEEERLELGRQMRQRASFSNTSASLKRLLETWADVVEGKPGTQGWAQMNKSDLAWEEELAK